jgi:hypothetical protein
MQLRRMVHHQEAARLEIDVDRAPRRPLRTYGHPPRGAERHQRDRKAFTNFIEMIVVRGDAVAASVSAGSASNSVG